MQPTYSDEAFEGVGLAGRALQVVAGDLLVEGGAEHVLDPGCGLVAEVGQGHGRGHVHGGQQPQEDDGEEAAHGEQDQDAAGVDDRAHEQEQAEQHEHGWRRRGK